MLGTGPERKEMKPTYDELKGLLHRVSGAIDPVLMRFDSDDKHNDVLMPLCEIGMEIEDALAPQPIKECTCPENWACSEPCDRKVPNG